MICTTVRRRAYCLINIWLSGPASNGALIPIAPRNNFTESRVLIHAQVEQSIKCVTTSRLDLVIVPRVGNISQDKEETARELHAEDGNV